MNINFLTSCRSLTRLVALLIIVLIQLPSVSPALDFSTSIQTSLFPVVYQSNAPSDSLTVFSNPTPFTVADRAGVPPIPPGVASLYPSPIVVSGMVGTVSDVNVTLSNVTAARPRDLDLLLVGPTGATFVIMADAGELCPIAGVNITLDDGAANALPNPVAGCPPDPPISNGSWRPANYVGSFDPEVFPAPAPAGPYNLPAPAGVATFASVFNGSNPNGTWNLYVVDDSQGGVVASFAGGWSIDITAVGGIDSTTTGIVSSLNPALTTQNITFTSTTTNDTTGLPVPPASGTVNFTNNGVTIPGCGAVAIAAGGQAQCTAMLAEGTRLIVANYSGTAILGMSNGSLTQVVNFPTSVAGAQFCNNGGLTIVDNSTSAPVYPSTVTVSGLFGTISKVTAQLNNFSAPRPGNIDFLLVGANNAGFLFMSDIGDSLTPASNLNFIFDDAAPGQPPQAALSGGTFRPTDYDPAVDPDTFPAPAPGSFSVPAPAGAATFASVYNTSNPNGSWRLFALDDGVGGGNSTITGWCLNFTIAPFATTTSVTSSANPSVFGAPVTFTATVTSAGGTPTGTVQFMDGASPIGAPVALNGSGVATLMISSLAVGNHTISANYSGATVGAGGGGFAAGSGSLTGNPQVVNKANTSTVITSGGTNPVGTSIPVTFTATVSPVAPGAGTRTGTVTFSRNGFPVSSCTNVAINASGQATCQITFTIAGSYNITAAYSGDTNFNASNNNASPFVQQAVGPTAANASVSGRVADPDGRGIAGARVAMQNQEGAVIWAVTNPFGYYRFTNVPTSQTYLVSVSHKRFEFQPRTVSVSDDLTDLDFTAEPGSLLNETPKGAKRVVDRGRN